AVALACRVRLRPILMTSLATVIGVAPMALKLGTGSEGDAPLARAIIGGLSASVVLAGFIVPATYLLGDERPGTQGGEVKSGGGSMRRLLLLLLLFVALSFGCVAASAQSTIRLSLKEAEAIALKNHPQVSAALLNALAANQVPTEVRAGKYPSLFASLTGA